ncbi:MAG TPA: hypothetical protein VH044_03550 [Polyangiaceae bacterium]|jgi:hypothetical protein|nr:hypothetical protein [Polyangiaceae bacterium]
MNIWKISTIGFAAALALVAGRDAVSTANAATGGSDRPSVAGFDWGMEQPHMQKALEDLRAARHSLEVAAEHKHGWRAAALEHTDAAIKDTVDGMEYARNHPHD